MKVVNFLFGLIIVNNVFASSGGACSDNEMRFNYASTSSLVVSNGSTFNLTINGSLKNGGDWDSTSVEIVGFNPICFNHASSSVSGSSWVDRVNTFSLTAPSVTGIYDMLITMHKDSGCNGCNKQKTITFGVGTLPTGPQGPTGPTGEPGQDGDDGQNGEDGADGQDGVDGTNGENGQDGTSCTVVENEDGSTTITCGEESVTIQPGQNGSPGENGNPGLDCFDLNANGRGDLCDPEALFEFEDCLSFQEYCRNGGNEEDLNVTDTNAKLIRASKQIFDCMFTEDVNGDGLVNTLDCQGQQGQQGNPGSNGNGGVTGQTGAPGSSCSVKDNHNDTYTMSCQDGTYVTWHDGQIGPQGQPGDTGEQGNTGAIGQQGVPGAGGSSCSSSPNDDGTTTIVCGNNSFILGNVNTGIMEVPLQTSQGGICGSIDLITLLAGLAIGSGAGFIRKK